MVTTVIDIRALATRPRRRRRSFRMRNPQRDLTPSRTRFRAVRIACVAIVAVGLLGASHAQAFSWGSWNSEYKESETSKTNYFDSIFAGHTYESSWSRNHDFQLDIDWKKVVTVVDTWIDENWPALAKRLDKYDDPRGATPMPEPAAALLFAIGVGVVAARRRL